MARTPWLDLPPARAARGEILLPGSKSISNRTLLLAALAAGETRLRGLLVADDVERMLEALGALGVRIGAPDRDGTRTVAGTAGRFPVRTARLHLGNAGTAFRPLTAVLALAGGTFSLSGVPRMHERPIGDLVDALRHVGADIRYTGKEGYPPLEIHPGAASAPSGAVPIRGEVSSQFVSALLMALPLLATHSRNAIEVRIVGPLISAPYVAITTNLMRRFGVPVTKTGDRYVIPAGAAYRSPGALSVEGDASGASYFLAAGVIGGGPVRVLGVDRGSIQGDVAFADALARMGADVRDGPGWIEARAGRVLRGLEVDCLDIPDAAMTLAVLALFAHGPTTLRNIGSWRVKETDRIAAMATELRKLGAVVTTGADFLRVDPPERPAAATIDTYDDHRIAMCFSLASLAGIPVRINDPECVRKTFPDYFAEFGKLTSAAA